MTELEEHHGSEASTESDLLQVLYRIVVCCFPGGIISHQHNDYVAANTRGSKSGWNLLFGSKLEHLHWPPVYRSSYLPHKNLARIKRPRVPIHMHA